VGRVLATDPGPGAVPPVAETNATESTPIAPAVSGLIEKLGDADPAVRETATRKLRDLGKAALPALRQARESDDPEVQSRVRSLIRKAERRLPPAAPARDGIAHRQNVRVSMVNGQRTVDVDDNGYKISIRQGVEGIVMEVTGVEDGKPVTETYKAKDADELKKENPEAFALYDKYNNGGPGVGFRIQMGGGNVQIQGNVAGGRIDPAAEQKMAEMQLKVMEKMLEQLQNHPNLPPEHRARIAEQVERLQRQQADVQQKLLQDVEDRRKKALDDMKVPLRDEPAEKPEVQEKAKAEQAEREKKQREAAK
jgi:hypothetical protein